jgi:hypothetical protein
MFDAVTENVLWEVQPYPRQGSNRFSVLFSPDSRFLATVAIVRRTGSFGTPRAGLSGWPEPDTTAPENAAVL